MACLFVIQGRDQGKRYDLDAPVVGLGREATNAIRLHDVEVSRRHAQVVLAEQNYKLVDLGSSNGTFVNEQRIEQHVLQSGDRVQVGRTLMIFTGNEDRSSLDLAAEVDIIGHGPAADGSRIVSSMSHEQGSHILADAELSTSPWLARARSNLQIMYRTALAVSHTLDIDQLLQRIMELIFEWVEADRGCIMLMDWESGEVMPKVYRSRRDARSSRADAHQPDDPGLRSRASRRRPHQRRAGRRTLGPGGQHPQAGRAGSDLRSPAGPLRRGRRDLHRHLHAAGPGRAEPPRQSFLG